MPPKRPLLILDGDNFAHRAYHALPKTIARRDGSPAGAVLGFANILLRLYRAESPRAVLVAWDTLEKPTYRHRQFPAYQSGREFDDALLGQFADLRAFVRACGFENARGAGYEADDFLAAAAAAEERRRGTAIIASGFGIWPCRARGSAVTTPKRVLRKLKSSWRKSAANYFLTINGTGFSRWEVSNLFTALPGA